MNKKIIVPIISVAILLTVWAIVHNYVIGEESPGSKDKEVHSTQETTTNQVTNYSEIIENIEEPIDLLEDTPERDTALKESSTGEGNANDKQTAVNKDIITQSKKTDDSINNGDIEDNRTDASNQRNSSNEGIERSDTSDTSSQKEELRNNEDSKKEYKKQDQQENATPENTNDNDDLTKQTRKESTEESATPENTNDNDDLTKKTKKESTEENATPENTNDNDEPSEKMKKETAEENPLSSNEDINVDNWEIDENQNINQGESTPGSLPSSDPHSIGDGNIPHAKDDIELPIVEID